jgi:D-alanyl-D-alanine dipeptidase
MQDKRTYWIEQMQAAWDYARDLTRWPIVECGEELDDLAACAKRADVPIDLPGDLKLGRFPRKHWLRRSLIEPVLRAADELAGLGYLLRIEDAYRTCRTQARGAISREAVEKAWRMARWELGGLEPPADLVFRRLSVWTATTPRFANHTAGSAIDLSLRCRRTGREVDLGGRYPELSEVTPMASPFISARARRHRDLLCRVLGDQGFAAYPYEFWHFSAGDADQAMLSGVGPARFGPIDVEGPGQAVRPVTDLDQPLITQADIEPMLPALRANLSQPA